ncbi:MAG: flagellar export protein FliJ [Fibrobacteres bacterium]|jgi:flagellar FliJ protein|nr:flagellar export protein FliJ [Fibrobacterota bacterium]
MKFRFQLEAALRVAQRAEESAKMHLGKCIGEQERIRQDIADLRTELREETALQQGARQGEIWAQGQTLFFDWVRGQAMKIAGLESEFLQAQAKVAEARTVLMEKRRAVEVMTRLKERRYAQWRLERARKELAEGSDVAARRWARSHATPS